MDFAHFAPPSCHTQHQKHLIQRSQAARSIAAQPIGAIKAITFRRSLAGPWGRMKIQAQARQNGAWGGKKLVKLWKFGMVQMWKFLLINTVYPLKHGDWDFF